MAVLYLAVGQLRHEHVLDDGAIDRRVVYVQVAETRQQAHQVHIRDAEARRQVETLELTQVATYRLQAPIAQLRRHAHVEARELSAHARRLAHVANDGLVADLRVDEIELAQALKGAHNERHARVVDARLRLTQRERVQIGHACRDRSHVLDVQRATTCPCQAQQAHGRVWHLMLLELLRREPHVAEVTPVETQLGQVHERVEQEAEAHGAQVKMIQADADHARRIGGQRLADELTVQIEQRLFLIVFWLLLTCTSGSDLLIVMLMLALIEMSVVAVERQVTHVARVHVCQLLEIRQTHGVTKASQVKRGPQRRVAHQRLPSLAHSVDTIDDENV